MPNLLEMVSVQTTVPQTLRTLLGLDPWDVGILAEDLADALQTTHTKTARLVMSLEKQGLVERFGKSRIGLTTDGRALAAQAKDRYETIRLFFVEVLHVNAETAKKEACRMESTLSDTSHYAMKLMLEQNTDWSELADLVIGH